MYGKPNNSGKNPERFIPEEIFGKKVIPSQTEIFCTFFVDYQCKVSSRIYPYFVNGTTQTYSCVRCENSVQIVSAPSFQGIFSLRSCPLPIIPISLSREEGMIHFFVGSHVKKPESGLFPDWIGDNTDVLRCSNWPKCRHPLVVVDFGLHFCLRNER